MSTTHIPKPATNKPSGQLVLPQANRNTAALSGVIDSVLHKLTSYQSESHLGCMNIGVVSTRSHVGVSTVAHRLAIQAALYGENNVLILDGNGIRPKQHQLSAVAMGPGIVDHMVTGTKLSDCIQKTSVKDLDVLTWGTIQKPGFTVSSTELKSLFAELRSSYQAIFMDLPCLDDPGSAALTYAMNSDGVLIVLDGTQSKEGQTKELVSTLEENGVKIIGAIMNRYTPVLPRWLRRWF